MQYEREGIPISDYCNCQVNFIESLKTKILVDNGLDLKVEDQTSMSEILDIQLDKNSIEPPDPGQNLDIGHLDKQLQKSINLGSE